MPCLQLSKQCPFLPLWSFTHSFNTPSLGLAMCLAQCRELRTPAPPQRAQVTPTASPFALGTWAPYSLPMPLSDFVQTYLSWVP